MKREEKPIDHCHCPTSLCSPQQCYIQFVFIFTTHYLFAFFGSRSTFSFLHCPPFLFRNHVSTLKIVAVLAAALGIRLHYYYYCYSVMQQQYWPENGSISMRCCPLLYTCLELELLLLLPLLLLLVLYVDS
jgi:hypothetical protein